MGIIFINSAKVTTNGRIVSVFPQLIRGPLDIRDPIQVVNLFLLYTLQVQFYQGPLLSGVVAVSCGYDTCFAE